MMCKLKLLILVLFYNYLNLWASEVDTLLVESKSMNKCIKNIVILPDAYDSRNQPLPVVYLLHGAGGSYLDWISIVPKIKEFSDNYDMIIVCPDGSKKSWYFDSPIDDSMRYETYISSELIEAVDAKYNTLTKKSKRAITGLSMGGHGALYLALKHQNLWGAAGSMSGGVDFRSFPDNWDIKKRLGDYHSNKEVWDQHTVINLTHLFEGDLKLIIDCGKDDFFFDANQRLHEKLNNENIDHDYIERPGGHNWEYWSNAVKYHFLFFNNFFNAHYKQE